MRGLRRGGLALLGLALAVSVGVAQQPGDRPGPAPGWWKGWFGGKPGAADGKPSAVRGQVQSRPAEAGPGREFKRHLDTVMRRIGVCDRLRDLAREANDPTLLQEADRLEELAWKVYERQAGHLFGNAGADAAALTGAGARPVRSAASLSNPGARAQNAGPARNAGPREDK